MRGASLGLFVIAPDSNSPSTVRKSLKVIKCALPMAQYRMSHGTNMTLFWWNLQVKNLTDFRKKIVNYEEKYRDRSVYVVDYALTKKTYKCC